MPIISGNTVLEDFEGSPTFISNNTRYGGGQGAAVTSDIVVQGNQAGGRRVDNAVNKGFGVAVPLTNLNGQHVKGWVAIIQIGLVTQLQLVVASGTGTGAVDLHTLPVSEYNEQLRAIPLWVNVDRTPEGGGGANAAAITEMGGRCDIGDVGGNALNFNLDLINFGGLLTWEGLGGAFSDFRTYEATEAEGVLISISGTDLCFARQQIGSAVATTFTDSGFSIKYPNQSLVADDFMGLTIDLQNASTVVELSDGSLESADIANAVRRPDLIVNGTAGSCVLTSVNALGHRLISLTNAVTVNGGIFRGLAFVQNGATLNDLTLRADTAVNVPFVSDLSLTDITNLRIEQSGSGHFADLGVIATDQSINWGVVASGFPVGATGSPAVTTSAGDETLLVSVSDGQTLTINVEPGATVPSVKNDGLGDVVIVAGLVSLSITGHPVGANVIVHDFDGTGGSLGTELARFDPASATEVFSYSSAKAGDQITVQMVPTPGTFKRQVRVLTLTADNSTFTFTPETETN